MGASSPRSAARGGRWPWWAVFLAGTLPLVELLYRAVTDRLGPDPAEAIIGFTGIWALRFLALTLAVTPLRQALGQRWMQRYRRMWGLYVWFYASLHLLAFLSLILDWRWQRLGEEVLKRPYITLGALAFVLLSVLGVTSHKALVRRLGRRWGPLHRGIYLIVVLAMIHFFWQIRSDFLEPLLYALLFAGLLGYRVWRTRGFGRLPS